MLLRIALELDLKRAMIGGVDKVYEIGRTFRNEGLDSTHAAEFSMLEAYEAYGDQFTMMELAKALVRRRGAGGRPHRRTRLATASEIDLEGEWRQASILDLVSEAVGEAGRPSKHRRRRCASIAEHARRRAAAELGTPGRSSSSSTSSSSRTT